MILIDIYTIVVSISTMMLMILIGGFIELRFKTTSQIKSIFIFIVINIAIPSVIINGFFTNTFDKSQFFDLGVIFLISICFNLLGLLISLFLFKSLGNTTSFSKQKALIAGVGNTGFIGIPIAFSIFGPIGGLYASFYDIGTILIVFSIGFMILQSKPTQLLKSLKGVINPPIITLVTCIIFIISNINMPQIVIELTGHLSTLTAPLAMFYIGFTLPQAYNIFKNNKFIKDTLLPLSIRLILLPILFLTLIGFLDLTEDVKRIIVLQTAMPSILLAPIFFKRYGYDETYGTIAVIYATLLSMVTIPIIAIFSNLIIF